MSDKQAPQMDPEEVEHLWSLLMRAEEAPTIDDLLAIARKHPSLQDRAMDLVMDRKREVKDDDLVKIIQAFPSRQEEASRVLFRRKGSASTWGKLFRLQGFEERAFDKWKKCDDRSTIGAIGYMDAYPKGTGQALDFLEAQTPTPIQAVELLKELKKAYNQRVGALLMLADKDFTAFREKSEALFRIDDLMEAMWALLTPEACRDRDVRYQLTFFMKDFPDLRERAFAMMLEIGEFDWIYNIMHRHGLTPDEIRRMEARQGLSAEKVLDRLLDRPIRKSW